MDSTKRVNKASHCTWQIHYHLVMPVKYRKALVDERVERVMKETAEGIGERYEIEMEALGMDKDHVHLLCGAHPKIAPGSIVRKFKSILARELFGREKWLKQELWGGSFWSSGYYVGTVGETGNWTSVETYVLEQGKPKEELRQLRLW